jgi:hypothetical protein
LLRGRTHDREQRLMPGAPRRHEQSRARRRPRAQSWVEIDGTSIVRPAGAPAPPPPSWRSPAAVAAPGAELANCRVGMSRISGGGFCCSNAVQHTFAVAASFVSARSRRNARVLALAGFDTRLPSMISWLAQPVSGHRPAA